MILNIIILWILILILSGVLWFLYKWYKQEQQEQDERMQVLEKRLEDYRREIIWKIQLETKIRNDFELKATEDIKTINKKLNKKNKKEV